MTDTIRRYPVNVFWSDEDQGFIATAPDLPGCSAFGGSKPEAVTEIEQAIEAWIEAARAAGNPIPEPSLPTFQAQPSGKLLVRMPRTLHASLAQAAKRENVSLNQYVVVLLASANTRAGVERVATGTFWHERYQVAHVWGGGTGVRFLDVTQHRMVSTAHVPSATLYESPRENVLPIRVIPWGTDETHEDPSG